jgi:hypothetical protein
MGLGSMTAACAAAMDGWAVMNGGSSVRWPSSSVNECGKERARESVCWCAGEVGLYGWYVVIEE